MTILKRYRLFLILALSMGLSGCSSTGTEEPPTENTTTENNITESSSAEVISTEATEESDDVESFFTDAKECVLTEDDYTFEYNGNTFDIYSNWSDYVDKLGYPEHYEENNYGYIDTEDDGYWWNMTYPDQSEYDNDFRVVFVSPSLTKEGEDTQLNNIALTNTPTSRGIKIGDSLTDLASVYGKPSSIEYFGNDADWVNIIYENDLGQITFVTDDNTILFTMLESKAPESDESSSDEEFFKLVSYLLYLEDYDGLPEDTIYYEIINSLSEDQRMLTSDLNSFLNDVLKTDKSFEAGYARSNFLFIHPIIHSVIR